MTYQTKESIIYIAKAAGVIAGVFIAIHLLDSNAKHNFQDKHDAVYNAIAAAHGWNPKHLSDDQDTLVEEETSHALMDANISAPED